MPARPRVAPDRRAQRRKEAGVRSRLIANAMCLAFGSNHRQQANHNAAASGKKECESGKPLSGISLERAQSIDSIWHVLAVPRAVTWSQTERGNKLFDRELEMAGTYGRVVLSPTPTPEDIAGGKVWHFVFRSFHPIPRRKMDVAIEAARLKRILPIAVMEKAVPEGTALISSSLEPSPVTAGPQPALEGMAFNWTPYFYGHHNRNPDGAGSNGVLRRAPDIDGGMGFFRAIPPGAVDHGSPERTARSTLRCPSTRCRTQNLWQLRPGRRMAEPIRPCVCRRASRNTARSVRAVRIAKGEWMRCPPRIVRGSAVHAAIASSVTQTVGLHVGAGWRRGRASL